ncbi:hypothetical protein Btru_035167 [Bulinus truncatus]|nr:hypothetical protein Btru_035167 [Bulinus truncatus]
MTSKHLPSKLRYRQRRRSSEDLDQYIEEKSQNNQNKSLRPVTLNQNALCTNFWDGQIYPVHKLAEILHQIPVNAWVTLDFTGISQLTDMVFEIAHNLRNKEESRFSAVKSIILDGCFMITNIGLEWIAETFPNLSTVSLVGCNKITSAGLIAVSRKCAQLNSMDISGTSVNFLPKRWLHGEGIRMSGCPILFPLAPVNVNDDKLEAVKDDAKNIYKVCIIRRENIHISLLNFIMKEKEKILPDFARFRQEMVNKELTFTFLEVEQSLSNFIVTDLSLVIITSELTDITKLSEEATSIGAFILEVLGKHSYLHFLLVGCSSSNNVTVSIDIIKEEVLKHLHRTADLIRDTNYSFEKIDQISTSKQMEFSSTRCLAKLISRISLDSIEIDIDKDDEGQLSSWTNKNRETFVCNSSWLCECLNLLMSHNNLTVANDGSNPTIADDVLVWPLEILQNQVINAKLNWDKFQQLFKGFSFPWICTTSTLTDLSRLPVKPIVPAKIFNEFKQSDETAIHLKYRFILNAIITPAIMQDLIMTTLKIHPPAHVWKTGVIIYDSIVAVMLGQTDNSKIVDLCAYMTAEGDKEMSSRLIYITIEKYKTVVEYILRSSGVLWEIFNLASENVETPAEPVNGVVHGHLFNYSEPEKCKQCGMDSEQASLLSVMEMKNSPSFLNKDLLKSAESNYRILGSAIEFLGPCTAKFAAVIDPFGCRECSVLLIQGNVNKLQLSVVYELHISSFELEDISTAMVTISHSNFKSCMNTLQKGMKLEGVDRFNRYYICIGTIEKINEDTRKVYIHFDGWPEDFDYWADFDSEDLHPVGFMAHCGHKLPEVSNLKPSLQPPPTELSVNNLRFPEMSLIYTSQIQNLHFLCPGQIHDFHLVNYPGVPLHITTVKQLKDNAHVLKAFVSLLILQKQVLPNVMSSLVTEAENVSEKKKLQFELSLKEILKLYLMHCLFYSSEEAPIAEQKSENVLDYANRYDPMGFSQAFSYLSSLGDLLCKGHKNADSSSSGLKQLDIECFQGLTSNIFILHLEQNPLTALPDNFFCLFSSIKELWLAGCNIFELPSIQTINSLEQLHISGNKLVSLPDSLAMLKNLKVLNVSYNPLEFLPLSVTYLESLVELYADNIGTVDLEIISPLKKLTKLSIAYNFIDFFPEAISFLPLTYFNMSGLPFLPMGISFSSQMLNAFFDNYIVYKRINSKERLKMLEKLEENSSGLINNKVDNLNKTLLELYPRIGNYQKQQDNAIPKALLKMTTLETLILPNHAFASVQDEISHLKSLKTFIIENNHCLLSISPQLGNLPLKNLNIKNCPNLKTPPKEIISRGFSAVMGYLQRLLQGFVSCKRTKLMMVGLGGAGKTSLVRALTSKHHIFFENYAEKITDGIDITEWLADLGKTEEENDPERNHSLHFNIWDFAGQIVYHNTHQFFLSNRAIYLLLWNIRLGYEHAGLDFWLSSIKCHAPKAPILIVGTHCDKVKINKIPEEALRKKFPQIVGFHLVSSYSGEGINELRESLINTALEQTYMGESIPEAWLSLENQLIKLRSEKALLNFNEAGDAANRAGIFDKTELLQAVQFLHDLGSVQFFNTPFLKSHVVILSQWIIDVMACLITVHDGPVKDGKFYHSDMAIVWQNYPENLHLWLLRLTEEFNLTFPLLGEDASIVPCLLPESEPEFDFTALNTDDNERESMMLYLFEYLPLGLFNRVQARLHQFSDSSIMWRKGFVLHKNNHRALLRLTSNTEMTVIARGCSPENTLFLVYEVVELLIKESYGGVSFDISVPCLCCTDEYVPDPSMFPASKVKRAFEQKIPFLQCGNNFHIVAISEILSKLPPDSSIEFDDHLGQSFNELQELNEMVAINVFIIYKLESGTTDLSKVDKAVTPMQILEDLRAAGFHVAFCDNPEKMSLDSLTSEVRSAQVVIVGLSDEFTQSVKCLELTRHIKQMLHKPVLFLTLNSTSTLHKTFPELILPDEVLEMHDRTIVEAIKIKSQKKMDSYPECFISYCWSNSKTAVDLGSTTKEGALGWGDPRKLKDYLQSHGINCWLDVEQTRQEAFLEDIAAGLRKAKVMVACVSDEYAASKKCKMEFRFAVSTLKIPIILAVVGTGYSWERSEIGLLSVGHSLQCLKINFQYKNKSGLKILLTEVQKILDKNVYSESTNYENIDSIIHTIAHHEVLELIQRKFLRRISMHASNLDMEDYPRLIIIDLVLESNELNGQMKGTYLKTNEINRQPVNTQDNFKIMNKSSEGSKQSINYCFRVFCEHEGGWHEMPVVIRYLPKEGQDFEDFITKTAPYQARLLAVLKYLSLNIPILTTHQGKQLHKKIDDSCTRSTFEFEKVYSLLLETVMEEDKQKTHGGLRKCHMPSGKILWLCDEHEKSSLSVTDVRYKSQLVEQYDQKNEDMNIDAALNNLNETELSSHYSNVSIDHSDDENLQRPVRLVSAGGGQLLPRKIKDLSSRGTSSKKKTSQACYVISTIFLVNQQIAVVFLFFLNFHLNGFYI